MRMNWTLTNIFFVIVILMAQLKFAQVDGIYERSGSSSLLKFFSPCNFPIPPASASLVWQPDNDEKFRQETEFINMCHIDGHQTYFMCDLHNQLKHQNSYAIKSNFAKHQSVLQQNGTYMIGILIVKHLAQPVSSYYITKTSFEFGCLFQLPCEPMTPETIEKYVKNIKTFTKVYLF
uniref:Uncharacterized protein n=1 Tax=Ditylenchus dipsaci TaxID=166011 RepID=A0A915DS54_9BILA